MLQSQSSVKSFEYHDHSLSRNSSSQSSYDHFKKYSTNYSAFSSVAELKAQLRAKELLREERQRKQREERRRQRQEKKEREMLQQQQQDETELFNPLLLCGIKSTPRQYLGSIPERQTCTIDNNQEEARDDQLDTNRGSGERIERKIHRRNKQQESDDAIGTNNTDHSAKKKRSVNKFSISKPIHVMFKKVWRILTCQCCLSEINQGKIVLDRSSGKLC